jgi:hypothetical protein
MSSVRCYPVHAKRKSVDICTAFARGCGGIVMAPRLPWVPDPSFFYGVDSSNMEQWAETLLHQDDHDFYYADNSYFDAARGEQFRVTRNGLQHSGIGMSDCRRFDALGIEIKPWRTNGNHIVVCPQSDDFMRRIVGYNGNWLDDIMQALLLRTERPIKIRHWNRNKMEAASTLHADLKNAWALVTWSSAAAIEAVLAGIPVVTAGRCAANLVSVRLDDIEHITQDMLYGLIARHTWAGVLADNQWTPDEMRRGIAWSALHR